MVKGGFQPPCLRPCLGPTQVWPICPFAWNAWKYALLMCSASSKIYILWCRLWFYYCLRSMYPNLFRFVVPTEKNAAPSGEPI